MKENSIIIEKDISEGVVERSYGKTQEIRIIPLEESLEAKEIPNLKHEKRFLENEKEIIEKVEAISQETKAKKDPTIMLDMNQDGVPDEKNERDQGLRIREKRLRKIKKQKKELKQREEDGGREFPY